MSTFRATPDQLAQFRERFDYNPATGELVDAIGTCRITYRNGYPVLFFRGKQWPVQRLIWAAHHGQWPIGHIRFKDGDRSNLRLDNLIEQLSKPKKSAPKTWTEEDDATLYQAEKNLAAIGASPYNDGPLLNWSLRSILVFG